jgi:uncharacterized protein (TIGR02453 family)
MPAKVLSFLRSLKENNSKEWFEANRSIYNQAQQELLGLTANMLKGISAFDPEVAKNDPAKCLFRIYRDVRFSKDKSPYKTYMSAYMAPGGKKSDKAGYYLHLEPGSSFVAAGVYSPEKEALQAVRQEIYYHPNEFESIIEEADFMKTFGTLMDEKLIRPPKGFPADFHRIEWLKYKHYIVSVNMPDQRFDNADILKEVLNIFEKAVPFNAFLNKAISMKD